MGMINLVNFISALKTSWIRRYLIDKLDDHWADLVDNHLGIIIMERDKILDYGPEKFNTIIKARLPGISSIFQAYKKVKTLSQLSQNPWTTHGCY